MTLKRKFPKGLCPECAINMAVNRPGGDADIIVTVCQHNSCLNVSVGSMFFTIEPITEEIIDSIKNISKNDISKMLEFFRHGSMKSDQASWN